MQTRALKEIRRVLASPIGIPVGKLLSDIREPKRASQRIEHRVIDRIAIGVTHGTDGMIEVNPRKNERSPVALGRSCF